MISRLWSEILLETNGGCNSNAANSGFMSTGCLPRCCYSSRCDQLGFEGKSLFIVFLRDFSALLVKTRWIGCASFSASGWCIITNASPSYSSCSYTTLKSLHRGTLIARTSELYGISFRRIKLSAWTCFCSSFSWAGGSTQECWQNWGQDLLVDWTDTLYPALDKTQDLQLW
jgi:hypothetical protein